MTIKITANKLLRAGLQSGTIMAAADATTQFWIEGKTQGSYDPTRTVRWAICGLVCHGPYFLVGFSMIDRTIVGKAGATPSLATVAKKTLAAQLILFPPYLVMLFSLMGVLEGKSTQQQIVNKVKERVPEAFAGGCVYWYDVVCLLAACLSTTFSLILAHLMMLLLSVPCCDT